MKTIFQAVCFFCFGLIYFLCQVSLTESQVVLVTRNVTDSFRIGKGGCKGNESVCTDRASCQDDGSCLCKKDYPNFRNPTIIKRNGTVQYGDSYGCMDNKSILLKIGNISCPFTPYQVIPNDHQEPATNFTNDERLKSCKYVSAEARYPTNITQDLTWLNETYIEFNNSGDNRTWYFKWKKSVPKLEGLIVTITFKCILPSNATECLQAKVFGTWRSSNSSMNRSQLTISSQISASHSPTKSSSTIATGTATSPNPSKPVNSTSKDDKLNTIIIAVAVAASLVVVIIIILVVCCLLKRKKNRKSIYKHSTYLCSYDNGHVNRGLFYGSGSDTADTPVDQTTPVKILNSEDEAPDLNIGRNKVNGGSGDTVVTPVDQTTPVKIFNSEYETPDLNIDRNKVNGGNGAASTAPADQTTPVKILNSEYETPDLNIDRNKVNGGNGAASTTPVDQTTQVKIFNSEYETPDVNIDRNKANGGSGGTVVTPADQATPVKILNSKFATPDDGIERIEVNGDMYAVVSVRRKKPTEKNNDKPNEVQYMDPEKLALDGVKDEEQSSQPTEYAEISGFIQQVDE